MLSDGELWDRVRALEGQIVHTLERQRPNTVSRVTDEAVEIEGRATKPTREDILRVYHHLHTRRQITGDDLYGDGSILGHPYARKTGRIILAILARAVPEEVHVVARDRTQRLSGIKLKARTV